MPEVRHRVIYGDQKGEEQDALVIAVHQSSRDIMHPWLSLSIVKKDREATCEVKGVKVRQTEAVLQVPHKDHAGPGHYWREDTSTPRTK